MNPRLAGVRAGGSGSRYPRRAGWGSDADPAVAAAAWLSGTPSLRPALFRESREYTSQAILGRTRRAERQRPHSSAGPREDRRYGGTDADLRGEPRSRG